MNADPPELSWVVVTIVPIAVLLQTDAERSDIAASLMEVEECCG